jgi:hypothetical protein
MQKLYWDLTEKERATLTDTEVTAFEALELMARGIAKPVPLETLLDPDPLPLDQVTVYRIKHSGYDQLDAAFDSAQAAQEFIAGDPWVVATHWLGGDNVASVCRLSRMSPTIEPATLALHQSIEAHEESIKKVNQIKGAHTKLRSDYKAAAERVARALDGMWSDWRECNAKAARMQHIASTFAEYQQMAGDDDIARAFMRKAFDAETLTEAQEWTGATYMPPDGVIAPEPPPVPEKRRSAGMPF